MLSIFKGKEVNKVIAADNDIVAIADANMIALEEVKDEVFSQKMMGDGVAFELQEDTVVSPCNGTLSVVFPTGHAYGITMQNGVEVMVHIGINTVESKGAGFQVMVKQGQAIKAGDVLAKVNRKLLQTSYDMTTMLIITDDAGQNVQFKEYARVERGEKINR